MYWRAEKYVVNLVAETIKRIIAYVPSLTNEDLEIVTYSSTGSVPETFEEYYNKTEIYPSVLVLGQGSQYVNTALNNLVDSNVMGSMSQGVNSTAYYILQGSTPIVFQLSSSLLGETVRGIDCDIASTGEDNYGDDIQISLIQNYLTAPITLATGSIPGTDALNFQRVFGNLDPAVTLGSLYNYWVKFSVSIFGSYYIGIDPNVNYNFIPSASVYTRNNQSNILYSSTGSVVVGSFGGSVYTPAIIRIGGMVNTTIGVKCSYKNSSDKARDLAELIITYFQLIKRAQLSRASSATLSTLLVFLNDGIIDEWIKRDVTVMNFRTGVIEKRRRGTNDIVFTTNISFTVLSEWGVEYDAQTLEDINVTVNTVDRL